MDSFNELNKIFLFLKNKGVFGKMVDKAIKCMDLLKKNFKSKSNDRNIDKSEGFRFRRKSLLLTYSDCDNDDFTPLDLIKALRKIEKDKRNTTEPVCNNIKSIVVSKEYHESGKPHFHVFIQFHETLVTSDSKLFDIDGLKHPNWRTVYTKAKAIRYIVKHTDFDKYPDPLYNPNFAQHEFDIIYYLKTSKWKKKRLAYQIINKFTDFHTAATDHPEIIWEYTKYQRNFQAYMDEENARNAKKTIMTEIKFNKDIVFDISKPKKSGHIYLVGPSNSGKSTTIEKIKKQFVGYNCPDDDDWTGYDDRTCDFMYFEEFGPHYTLNRLNRILDPYPNKLRIKCLPGVIKNEYKPVFICSNYFPHEIYHKVSKHKLNTFLQRIKIIYMDQNHKFHLYWDPETMTLDQYNFSWTVDNIINNNLIPTSADIMNDPKNSIVQFKIPKRYYNKMANFYADILQNDPHDKIS